MSWNDVAGLNEAKEILKETVIRPTSPHLHDASNSHPPSRILLCGPPGVGKTFLAKAIASEVGDATFISLSAWDLVSKFVSTHVKSVFDLAQESRPSIIFIDDLDCFPDELEPAREAAKMELISEMQDRFKDLFIIGASAKPWALDFAIRQSFDKNIFITLPDTCTRVTLFKSPLKKTPHSLNDDDFEKLAMSSEGFSPADINAVINDGMMQPVRKLQTATHFKKVQGPSATDPNTLIDDLLAPCSPDDANAVEMNWTQVPTEKCF